MKKTLISIITLAALASSSVYAKSVEQDIQVSAEILSTVKMSDPAGGALAPLKLDYDTALADGTYNLSKPIQISSINGYKKVKLTLAEEFKLVETNGTAKEFARAAVMIDHMPIGHNSSHTVDLNNGTADKVITIAAKANQDALDGEVYAGTVKLVMEPQA
ncbi:MAG: hypothetical protein RLY17_305 [Pseudomonadota bacterium]|jgi:hypothetical protein